LGLIAEGYLSPNTKVGDKVWNAREKTVMSGNDCPPGVPSMCTQGLFIGIVTHGYYNVRTAPIYLPYFITTQSQGHYSPL
jgi:hypothetical protein